VETMMQMLDSLEYFAATVNDAFSTLTKQIQERQITLQNLGQRIKVVQNKNQKVRANPNKATSIYSLHKLPVEKTQKNRKVLICETPKKNLDRKNYGIPATARYDTCESINTVDVYNAMQVSKEKHILGEEREGLGKLPRHFDTLTSCLLFNTTDNPYQKYATTMDALEGVEGVDRKKEIRELQLAPVTIVDGQGLPFYVAPDLAFKPELQNVPQFNMPKNLPGIEGVADLSWSTNDAMQTIAPSATMGNLPTFDVMGRSITPIQAKEAPPMPATAPPSAPVAPPPAAPTAPPPAAPPSVLAAAAPPKAPAPKPKPTGDSGTTRNALLDAIRKGRNLKKKTERKRNKTPPPPANDIMSALKRRLAERRKATSGTDTSNKKARRKPIKQQPPSRPRPSAAQMLNSKMDNLRKLLEDEDPDENDSQEWSE